MCGSQPKGRLPEHQFVLLRCQAGTNVVEAIALRTYPVKGIGKLPLSRMSKVTVPAGIVLRSIGLLQTPLGPGGQILSSLG